MSEFDTLVLCGAGIKGLTLLGGLQYLYKETQYLDNITCYSGTSIGSVISVLLSLGFSPLEIYMHSYKISNVLKFNFEQILNIKTNYGLTSNKELIESLLSLKNKNEKFKNINTLQDLYDYTKKEVYITTCAIPNKRPVYLNYKTHPNLSILDALRMSCNIPLIFEKIIYNGEYYLDGGIIDNFPINIVRDKKVLGINILYDSSNGSQNLSLLEYTFYCLLPITTHIHSVKNIPIFELQNHDYHSLNFNINLKQRREIFQDGYDQMNEKIIIYELDNSETFEK